MNPPELHSLFSLLTGLAPPVNMHTEFRIQSAWLAWSKTYTADDLRLVVRFLKKQRWEIEMIVGALKFSRLIEDPNNFADRLAEARAWERNYRQPKAPSLTPVICTPPQSNHSKRVSAVIKNLDNQKTFQMCIDGMRKAAQ